MTSQAVIAVGPMAQSSLGERELNKILKRIGKAGGTLEVKRLKEFDRIKACLTQAGGMYAVVEGKDKAMHQVRYAFQDQIFTVNCTQEAH